MQFRIGIVVCSIIAGAAGCATGGTSGAQATYMQSCTANANTEQERSECAWKNADRMAGGR
jgi:hypothetical protein